MARLFNFFILYLALYWDLSSLLLFASVGFSDLHANFTANLTAIRELPVWQKEFRTHVKHRYPQELDIGTASEAIKEGVGLHHVY